MATAGGSILLFCLGIFVFLAGVSADTPANCTYDDLLGSWTFYVGKGGQDLSINCSSLGQVQKKIHIKLTTPDIAVDEFGNRGFWTLIYNQGFEVVIHGRKYFAFSKYEGKEKTAVSYCDQTMPGWSHDVLGHDWACFSGRKNERKVPKVHAYRKASSRLTQQKFKNDPLFIQKINDAQNTWTAGLYQEYESMTVESMIRRAGGRKSKIYGRPKPAPATDEIRAKAAALPKAFDWRNVNGQSYVSPVRNQGGCGSCYAFASMAMNEARLRIVSNNTVQSIFSPQEIVDCSQYSQGCDGGFPYLIGGKYAEDFGLVEESCYPYKGKDGTCAKKSCSRHYSTKYRYVGGYYGGCNQELMRISLVENGPFAVSFEVYPDFKQYKSGVYIHTSLKDGLNPFEITNHVVLIVGYGHEQSSGLDFWIVKNSWGSGWGEDGFFRIRRGSDECGIESIAADCNEDLMKISLVKYGPMAVAFEVYDDFFHYKGGIYQHSGLKDRLNPFELTNHAVTLVGYGESDGVNFWSVKNSWGPTWGENGYFRIRRGTDECSIESIAVESFVIF